MKEKERAGMAASECVIVWCAFVNIFGCKDLGRQKQVIISLYALLLEYACMLMCARSQTSPLHS